MEDESECLLVWPSDLPFGLSLSAAFRWRTSCCSFDFRESDLEDFAGLGASEVEAAADEKLGFSLVGEIFSRGEGLIVFNSVLLCSSVFVILAVSDLELFDEVGVATEWAFSVVVTGCLLDNSGDSGGLGCPSLPRSHRLLIIGF